MVAEFELFHGIALTKLVRSDNPVTLRMIETTPSEAWAAYKINDAVILYIKYRTRGLPLKRTKGATSWLFVFSPSEAQRVQKMGADKPVYLCLVCANQKLNARAMHVCLLEPHEVAQSMDFASTATQAITVLYQPGKSLRAYGTLNSNEKDRLVVPRNRLESWRVPGS